MAPCNDARDGYRRLHQRRPGRRVEDEATWGERMNDTTCPDHIEALEQDAEFIAILGRCLDVQTQLEDCVATGTPLPAVPLPPL